jgi:hypothetical protein
VVSLVLIAPARKADAQPANLFSCLGGGDLPYCRGPGTGIITDLGCGQSFELFSGRVTWYPLRCLGPITIEINARAFLDNRYPLYVEIVPEGSRPCLDPGYLVMIARGGFDCGYWESISVDITDIVPLGSTYALQVVFFEGAGGSRGGPGLDCVRITSHPVAVSPTTWGRVKALFK